MCISPTRFLVHSSIRAEFAQKLAKHAQSLKVGDGQADGVAMGPLANARRLSAMTQIVDDARARGATVSAGGERIGSVGQLLRADGAG